MSVKNGMGAKEVTNAQATLKPIKMVGKEFLVKTKIMCLNKIELNLQLRRTYI
jgi:hypothetical protein